MCYTEKVIRISQVTSSIVFIAWCMSIMLHVVCLITSLNSFKIFTVSRHGSLFVSVVIFITGPWIISAGLNNIHKYPFSNWSKGSKCMGEGFFFGGGRRILCSYLFLEHFCMADFPQLSKYMAIVEEFQTILWACSEFWKQCMHGVLISLSILILLHHLTLKLTKSNG